MILVKTFTLDQVVMRIHVGFTPLFVKITRTRYFYIRVLLKRQTWDNLETSFETSALSLLYAIKLIYPYPRSHQFTVSHLIG